MLHADPLEFCGGARLGSKSVILCGALLPARGYRATLYLIPAKEFCS